MLELGQTWSLEQLVIDNDIIAMCRRVAEGTSVTDETLATDIIKEVGVGGNFLTKKHTLAWMDREESFPLLLNRQMRGAWTQKTGGKDLADVAHERWKEVLREHKVPDIEPGILKDMEAVVAEADKAARR